MDLLTQGLLGAALAQSAAKKEETRTATWVGFLAGLLADADVLIRSSDDHLLNIEFHRHFSHSIFFIPLGALIAALILWPFAKNKLNFKRLYIFSLLGYSLSGVLDACTSYGTHLFWPVINERIAWNLISIIDPVFTLTLMLAVIFSFRKYNFKIARWGLLLATVYMSIGWLQLQRAETALFELAEQRQHRIERFIVKPTISNLILWRSIYQANNTLYVDGIRTGLSNTQIYTGNSVTLFDPEKDIKNIDKSSVLYNDILRFTEFSDGYVAMSPDYKNILSDVRYSNETLGINPLWGLEINSDKPDQHAKFNFYRIFSSEYKEHFLKMLRGD